MLLQSPTEGSIWDAEIHQWMNGQNSHARVCMWCAQTRLWAAERWGGVWGGAYLGLHNGSANLTWLCVCVWERVVQATRSPFLSLSRAQQGMRADGLLMPSGLCWCMHFIDRVRGEALSQHCCRLARERIWNPAVVSCVGMDIAALHQGYSNNLYSPHYQVGSFVRFIYLFIFSTSNWEENLQCCSHFLIQ